MITETKEFLTDMRYRFTRPVWNTDLFTDLERAYGKYLYVPFDVPKIEPKNMADFVRFYYRNAKVVEKKMSDFVDNKEQANEVSPYLSITSPVEVSGRVSAQWAGNEVPEIYDKFPELFDQFYEYFPFAESSRFGWTMWSSNKDIPAHRDYGVQVDVPITIRTMLFDNNPSQSLRLFLDPLDKQVDFRYNINLPKDTNTFAWNNLRQKHYSVYTPGHRKILWIISPFMIENAFKKNHVNQYVDLLDRSIAKYKEETVVDNLTDTNNYLNVDVNNIHEVL